MLTLPLQHSDLTVKLPPGLQLGATPAGHLDCRMQLLGVQLDWPATTGKPQYAQLSQTNTHLRLPSRAAFKCLGATQQHCADMQQGHQQYALYANSGIMSVRYNPACCAEPALPCIAVTHTASSAHTMHAADVSCTGGGAASCQHEVLPARSSAAGFACRSGALLLAHALFPDHTHHLLTWLAVPVAAADALGVLAAGTPAEAQDAVRSKAQRVKARLQRRGTGQQDSSRGVGWVDGVQGVVEGSLHTLRSLSGALDRVLRAVACMMLPEWYSSAVACAAASMTQLFVHKVSRRTYLQ